MLFSAAFTVANVSALTLHPEFDRVKVLESWLQAETGSDLSSIRLGNPASVNFQIRNHAYLPNPISPNSPGTAYELQNLTYAIQISDSEGVTVFLELKEDNVLPPRGVVRVSENLPEDVINKPGSYEAQLIIWREEKIGNEIYYFPEAQKTVIEVPVMEWKNGRPVPLEGR
jgi:hypothetical protein